MLKNKRKNLKKDQWKDQRKDQLKCLIQVAKGELAADLLIKNVKILDLVCGDLLNSAIVIHGDTIAGVGLEYQDAKAKAVWDARGLVAVPGFIDAHVHLESSLLNPFEFGAITLPLGTTTVICDPHEIANVIGVEGVSWFIRCSELTRQNLFIQIPSCVPALPGFETNGSKLLLKEMIKLKDHPNVIGLAEMMNFPGVINGADQVMDKIVNFSELGIDGHCPLLTGKELNAYIAAGIRNCHETITFKEAKEKLQKGMALLIREGTVAKNLKTLAPVVSEFNSLQCLLCTDDRSPREIINEGHINFLLKRLIQELKVPLHIAYRMASYSAAQHFGLKKLGLIAPGKKADMVFLNDLSKIVIDEVIIGGQKVSQLDQNKDNNSNLNKSLPPRGNTIKREFIGEEDLVFDFTPGYYNVIEIIPGEIITNHLQIKYENRRFASDDINKIAVIERYGHASPPALGLVKGMGLKRGAIASSVAHDSHNIIVVGAREDDMALAVNALITSGGGYSVVENGNILKVLPLPLAGLISLESGDRLVQELQHLSGACKHLGVNLDDPFLQMAFLALPVIPSLKITDMGLINVAKFEFISLKVN